MTNSSRIAALGRQAAGIANYNPRRLLTITGLTPVYALIDNPTENQRLDLAGTDYTAARVAIVLVADLAGSAIPLGAAVVIDDQLPTMETAFSINNYEYSPDYNHVTLFLVAQQ